jgi:NADH-ubiquinone oxidoreductase chain 1
LGALRSVAQTISYEIILSFCFFFFAFFFLSYSFLDIFIFQNYVFNVFIIACLFFIFFVRCVIETNRAPFDLSEGESELVSGFNVEYGGLKFALIFIAEYASII